MEISPILSTLLRSKTGALLIALQIAISLSILANAAFVVQQRSQLAGRPSGIGDERSVFYIRNSPVNPLEHEAHIALQHTLRDALRAIPGVQAVALVNQMPMSRSGNGGGMAVDRNQVKTTAHASRYNSPDSMVSTLGLKLIEGRDFKPEEVTTADPQLTQERGDKIIISKPLAQKLFPDASHFVGLKFFDGVGARARELQIIGVVERLQKPWTHMEDGGEYSVISADRLSGGTLAFAVRAAPEQLDRIIRDAEATVKKITNGPAIVRTKTSLQHRTENYRADYALAWMLVTVCVLLMLVTASGIVGMTTLWVTQRHKTIGIRRALGARRVDILRYFLTENFLITSMGVGLGLVLTLGLNELLVVKLEMARLPWGYMASGVVAFWGLGLAAVYGPSFKAASISPAVATRSA